VKEALLLLGYNTNGFAFHRLDDALEIIAGLGYRCVAITVDHHALNPYDEDIAEQVEETRTRLGVLGLSSVIETGARFLLDPRRKHCPTLLDRRGAGRDRRMDFLRRCIDIAEGLGSSAVSFWSGALAPGQNKRAAFDLLAGACADLSDYAAGKGVVLAFEPEPGMMVDTLEKADRLADAVGRDNVRLTLDVGHLQCNETEPPADLICRYAPRLANVHLDDMRRGAHDHLFFGDGEVDFKPILAALEVSYKGPACVELSRHSHNAVEVAERARRFLDPLL
jgi:L-ribulose-5-phosphate 3-epimerase